MLGCVHRALCDAALGNESVYVNEDPMDDRTTEVCADASRQEPMTLAEWSASRWGRPPRLRPFHLCRGVLVGGRKEWFAW